MSDLRPPLLDEYGLADALDWLCTRFGKLSKLEIKSDFSKTTNRLEPAKELAFFRITQEALTNVVKHAAARWASVGLRCEDGQVVLEIRDDGVGFDPNELRGRPKPGGLGLLSMRERALAIGAELRVDSVLGKGTRVVVALPE
jgi:two-component system sensor histidine kinase UhpB